MKRIIIWNKHGDEERRIRAYLEAGGYEVVSIISDQCPSLNEAHGLALCEEYLDRVPHDVRRHSMIYLCGTYSTDTINQWVGMGYRAYFPKEKTAHERCPDGMSAIVPPFILHPNAGITDGTGGICGMVYNLDKRNWEQYLWAQQAGITVCGTNVPIVGDMTIFRHLRWLWHTKTIGYVCNAVIKALISGVPVLTNPETMICGYETILKDGENCLIRKSPEELKASALGTSEETWRRMSKNCWASRELFCKVQPDRVSDLVKLVELVLKKE